MKYYHYTYLTIFRNWRAIYYGVKSCDCHPEDDVSYLGSGRKIKNYINKYGKHSFTKIVDRIYKSPELAYAREAEVVDQEWVKHPRTLNIMVGGKCPPALGRRLSQDTKDKIAHGNTGKTGLRGYKYNKVHCEYCYFYGSRIHYSRYHGEKCLHNHNLSKAEIKFLVESRKAKKNKYCSNCDEYYTNSHFTQWHGDKCKNKVIV